MITRSIGHVEACDVLCGRRHLAQADADIDRPRRAFVRKAGSELTTLVITPCPQPSRRIYGIAGITPCAHSDEGDVLWNVYPNRHVRVELTPDAELTAIIIAPRRDATVLKDGNRLAVVRSTPASWCSPPSAYGSNPHWGGKHG